MAHVYAFDNRGGKTLINEQVTAHRPRKPTPTGVEHWTRHPRIDWQAAPPASAPTRVSASGGAGCASTTPPVPATAVERLQRYGGVYAAAAQMLAGEPPSPLAEQAQAPGLTEGVYEALIQWERERDRA